MKNEQFDFNVRINCLGKNFCAPDWKWDTGRFAWKDLDLWTVTQRKNDNCLLSFLSDIL